MTLGTLIKQTRQEKQLSQPQLSEMAGIEQSYLSKLENDKSLPSDEILTSILNALDLTLTQLLDSISSPAELRRLQQVPLISQRLVVNQRQSIKSRRIYLTLCALLCAFAVAMFYAGYNGNIFTETRYQYMSHGILQDGENPDVFTKSAHQLVNRNDPEFESKVENLRVSIEQRRFRDYLYLDEFVGDLLIRNSEDGRRAYHYREPVQQERTINGWLQAVGVFLLVLSLLGFLLERRLIRHHV
ncbi:helix-turn-helix domain-containing protein [Thalassotalea mangrovi]|uniref:Helix-turn-helix transcriptional regulator n=1 Tax=Thalassotalea mangrovi TaxID=2572245 RepID=A0A4U1B309_9GAMM|nr:helix-turn-helix transcriptional regulator [Thalassotalea mangrovi]TKB43992.1 helix-turn-helix transcriptional regulator [Thalassotalea mangrovi]